MVPSDHTPSTSACNSPVAPYVWDLAQQRGHLVLVLVVPSFRGDNPLDVIAEIVMKVVDFFRVSLFRVSLQTHQPSPCTLTLAEHSTRSFGKEGLVGLEGCCCLLIVSAPAAWCTKCALTGTISKNTYDGLLRTNAAPPTVWLVMAIRRLEHVFVETVPSLAQLPNYPGRGDVVQLPASYPRTCYRFECNRSSYLAHLVFRNGTFTSTTGRRWREPTRGYPGQAAGRGGGAHCSRDSGAPAGPPPYRSPSLSGYIQC